MVVKVVGALTMCSDGARDLEGLEVSNMAKEGESFGNKGGVRVIEVIGFDELTLNIEIGVVSAKSLGTSFS